MSAGPGASHENVLALALLYLIVGLARPSWTPSWAPSWAMASKRRWVVLRAGLAIVLAAGAFVGVLAYTHAQPDGPHSMMSYLDEVTPEQLRRNQ